MTQTTQSTPFEASGLLTSTEAPSALPRSAPGAIEVMELSVDLFQLLGRARFGNSDKSGRNA